MKHNKILILLLFILLLVIVGGCSNKTTVTTHKPTSPSCFVVSGCSTSKTSKKTNKTTSSNTSSTASSSSATTINLYDFTPTSSSSEVINYYKDFDFDFSGLTKEEIMDRVYSLISVCNITISYTNTKDYFQYTDKGSKADTVELFYTHLEVETRSSDGRLVMGSASGECNREHVWPQSLGQSKDEPGGYDLHHVRPTLYDLNEARGNLVYGNVAHISANEVKYKGTVYAYKSTRAFEPKDDVKGDVARIVFYYAIKYDYDLSIIVDDKTCKDILEWNELDPVSEIEIMRNNEVEKLQNNRNIFIDYPELANYIWE